MDGNRQIDRSACLILASAWRNKTTHRCHRPPNVNDI